MEGCWKIFDNPQAPYFGHFTGGEYPTSEEAEKVMRGMPATTIRLDGYVWGQPDKNVIRHTYHVVCMERRME